MEYKEIKFDSQTISDDCLINQTEKQAIDIAIERIRINMIKIVKKENTGKGFKYELAFIIKRPKQMSTKE